ncbi:MAG TPA: tetratricopeptide repeat protein, partial [Aggregatilineales bacterium]|nr:tetratricopeptide repeat protein [Aggregatilineales bacterium]
IEGIVTQCGGMVVRPRGEGDSRFAVFTQPSDAIQAAAQIQRALYEEEWPMPKPLRVRMALHTGEADLRMGDYYGSAVNRCARLRSLAYGGQTLISRATAELVRDQLQDGIGLDDLGQHRLKDLIRPEQVFQLQVTGLPGKFPALHSLDVIPNNLPVQATSFVGRESEMAEIKTLLGETRLLTLTGSGGAGKTRLSLQVAADLLENYPDGVWLVELAPVSTPTLVPSIVAEALGASSGEPGDLTKTLVAYLRDKRTLLILDNCEHLVEACAQFASAILRGCPDTRMLASSREALGVNGEVAWRIPSLLMPDPLLRATPETLNDSPAVHLFVERARAARPDFSLTDQNAPAVAQICQRLDGIPLAIELATTRLRALSVEQIAARLDDCFRLLTGGSRTALPRQQTLRTLIDWSYDLLSEPERTLLRRLSVFAGGLSLEAAEAVCAGDDLDSLDVLDLLQQLVNKSLVVADESGDAVRYRLLQTIRQYARERLLEAGEAQAVQNRHLDFYIALTTEGEPHTRSWQQKAWFERYDLEMDNLRGALEWAISAPRVQAGLQLSNALWYFWFRRGYWVEAVKWMMPLIESSVGSRDRERASVIMRCASISGRQTGDKPISMAALIEEAMTVARDLNEWGILALGTLHQAMTQEDDERRLALLQESIAQGKQSGDDWNAAPMLYILGDFYRSRGDAESARALYVECLTILRRVGDLAMSIYPLGNLGRLAFDVGDYKQAEAAFEECIAIAHDMRDNAAVADWLIQLGNLKLRLGQFEAVRAIFEECLDLSREMSNRSVIGDCLVMAAQLAAADGEPERAARLFGAGQAFHEDEIVRAAIQASPQRDANGTDIRAQMGDKAFDLAWMEGYALPPDDAIAFALSKPIQIGRAA